jgi:hypothetical protein
MSEFHIAEINNGNTSSSIKDQQQQQQQQQQQEKASQYSEIAAKLIDKLLDKDVSLTYTFDHLEIDIPSARGPGGKELVGAKWVIDGKINIATTSTSIHSNESSSSSLYSSSYSKYVTA